MPKVVWIDLDNIPHVQVFHPLIKALKEKHNVLLTARDHAYTCELLDSLKYQYLKVGKHYGANKLRKVLGTVVRAVQLISVVSKIDVAIAVSHGSRSQIIAAKLMRLPVITMFDYEYVFSPIFEKLSDLILVPALLKQVNGIKENVKYVGFPGYKEDLYISKFKPDPDFVRMLGIDQSKVNVTLRPPASSAHYHNPQSDRIFDKIISHIEKQENVQAFLVPRHKSQLGVYSNLKNINVLSNPVSGLDLLWNSDLVIGGGGTMNREAALLGIPVYSVFRGSKGILDCQLEKEKKLTFVENDKDLQKIKWKKRGNHNKPATDYETTQFITSKITEKMELLEGKGRK